MPHAPFLGANGRRAYIGPLSLCFLLSGRHERNKMEEETFQEKCCTLRKSFGYKQDWLANELGLKDQKAYSRMERRQRPMAPVIREALARMFGFRSAELLEAFRLEEAIALWQEHKLRPPCTKQDWQTERKLCYERIKHLDEEVVHLLDTVAFLRNQLKEARHQKH